MNGGTRRRCAPALAAALVLLVGLHCGCDGGGEAPLPPVGPSIGGQWAGRFFVAESSDIRDQAVTATIRQNGDAVIIETSLVGVGARLTGAIDAEGNMVLTDPFDGETWTTFFGPATPTAVTVADFLLPPTPEDASTPLNVIQLTR